MNGTPLPPPFRAAAARLARRVEQYRTRAGYARESRLYESSFFVLAFDVENARLFRLNQQRARG
jgi:hypothetical protein